MFVFYRTVRFFIFVKFQNKPLIISVKQFWLCLCLFLCVGVRLYAQGNTKPLVIDANTNLSLAGYLSSYQDSTGQLTLVQAMAKYKTGQFEVMPDYILNAGFSSATQWVHFSLQARDKPYSLMLGISNPRINHLNFYQVTNGKVVKKVITGDNLAFESRGFLSRNFVVPITVEFGQPSEIFIMAEKRFEVLAFQTKLYRLESYQSDELAEYMMWGIITGLIVFILVLNMVLTVATKDRIYLWYLLLILSSSFQIASQTGLGFQYLWNNTPSFNRYDTTALAAWLIMASQIHFVQQFIRQTAQNSKAFRFVQFYKMLLIGIFVLLVLTRAFNVFERQWFQWMYSGTLYCILSSVALTYWSLFERIRKRESEVIFYIIVLSFQLIGYVMVFLLNLRYTQPGVTPLFHVDSYFLMVAILLMDLLVITMGLLYFRFNEYRRQNEALLTTLHLTQQEQSERTIEALEMERNRIAEDLYDDVGAMLSTAIGYISSLLRRAEIREQYPILGEARKLLNTAIENLRTVSHNLMPKNFAYLGLAKSLEETIRKVSRADGINFHYVCVGQEVRLNTATEVQIFRIATDLIQNVLKLSGATEATLQLVYHAGYLNLILEDNGLESQRFAQSNLTSKVNFVNGSIDIDTSETGTTVIVEIPIEVSLRPKTYDIKHAN